MNHEIKLVTAPVISHELEKIGAQVTSRIERLNIDGMLATEDTIQSMKSLRAELNNEIKNWEEQRKTIKKAVASPYQEFEEVYKTNIAEPYSGANTILKDKIGEFEDKVKNEKESNLRGYFSEYLIHEKIEFVTFENVGLSINLSKTEKAYRKDIDTFIEKIKDDLDLIKTTEFEAEILVQYKSSLNVSASIKSVKERKGRERVEKLRLLQQEKLRRNAVMHSMGLKFDSMTKTWAYNDDIYVSDQYIVEVSKDTFNAKIVELEEKIKAHKEAEQKAQEKFVDKAVEKMADNIGIPKKEAVKPIPKPIQKPVEKPKEDVEIVTAQFECKGTLAQLKALGQYMKDNDITYKNI